MPERLFHFPPQKFPCFFICADCFRRFCVLLSSFPVGAFRQFMLKTTMFKMTQKVHKIKTVPFGNSETPNKPILSP